jgi:hypothetical protein
LIIPIVFDAFDAPDSWHTSLYLKALIQGFHIIGIHDYFNVLVIYVYYLILQLYFSELSASIAPSSAPPYNNSLLLRGLLVLYAQLFSQSKLESSTMEALSNTSPMLHVALCLK